MVSYYCSLRSWSYLGITNWCKPFIISTGIFASEIGLGFRRMQLPSLTHVLLYLQLTSLLIPLGFGSEIASSILFPALLVVDWVVVSQFVILRVESAYVFMSSLAVLGGKLRPEFPLCK